MAKDRFERHKQPWTGEEAGQLRTLAAKGQGLKQIAKDEHMRADGRARAKIEIRVNVLKRAEHCECKGK